jgi:hypothetical protein
VSVDATFEILDRTPTAQEEEHIFLSSKEERDKLDNDAVRANTARVRTETELLQTRYKEDRKTRKQYALISAGLAIFWTVFSVGVCLVQIWGWGDANKLKSSEFIAIVATALATIVALYLQVGKGMFAKNR